MSNKLSRRSFVKKLAIGTGGVIVLGNFGFYFETSGSRSKLQSIVVDFAKCAGCRTCEMACASSNHTVNINGEIFADLGNPYLANIKVSHFNPDVDIPNVCQLCPDSPCIEACPVDPDPKTGRKALYRDENLQIILNDTERCIACTSCADACKKERRGIIIPNPETKKPERLCTLCKGDPQCIKNCPYDALSLREVDISGEYFGKSTKEIAKLLYKKFYDMS
jgi:Fe-S-cluster-containing hydrogenase component 2